MANQQEEGRGTDGSSVGVDRLITLSDGVFAIAITLLVLTVEVPEVPADLVAEELPGQLLSLRSQYLSYVISFLVVLLYWMAHHSTFNAIRGCDTGLLWLNGLFLMFVAFLPFPTELLGEYPDQQLVVAIYAGYLAVTRLMLTVVWWYASSGRRLVDAEVHPGTIRVYRLRGLIIPLIFLVSIGISFFSVRGAVFSWLVLLVGDFILLRILRR